MADDALHPNDSSYVKYFSECILLYYRRYASIIHVTLKSLLTLGLIFAAWKFRTQLFDAIKISFTIGWVVCFVPLLFSIWNFFASKAWYVLLYENSTDSKQSLWQLYFIRIQGQALNLILPLCGLGGEALRSAKIAGISGARKGVISVVSDKVMDFLSEIALTCVGGIVASRYFPHSSLVFFVSVVLLILMTIFLVWGNQLISYLLRIWPSLPERDHLHKLTISLNFGKQTQQAFWYHIIEHILMASEFFIVAWLLGIHLGLIEIFLINTIASVFNLLFIFIPGRLGAYECSVALAFNLLSLPSASGISVALIRRARQLLVCAIGILLIFLGNSHDRIPRKVKMLKISLSKAE